MRRHVSPNRSRHLSNLPISRVTPLVMVLLLHAAAGPLLAAPAEAQASEDGADGGLSDVFGDGAPGDEGLEQGPAGDEMETGGDVQAGDDLLIFEEMPVVISASRRASGIHESAVPVSVVTNAQIRDSAATNLAEALLWVPGVDVLRADRNRWLVGVRGFLHDFSDRTLTLIDGRDATNLLTGATDWRSMPVLLEDVDRIEVVRGPGGAAWGANAFNGAINVITKSPRDTHGWVGATHVNEFGDVFTQGRWGASDGDWHWRLSAGFDDYVSSAEALDRDSDARDFGQRRTFSGHALLEGTPESEWSFGLDYSHMERGDFQWVTHHPQEDERHERVRAYSRIDHEFDHAEAYVEWMVRHQDVNRPSLWQYQATEKVIEAQIDFTPADRHEVTIGGNVSRRNLETGADHDEQLRVSNTPRDELWAGLFVMDRWQATDRLALEGQGRIDWYSETTADWSGRLAALYSVDPDQRHVLRAAGARAFRAPLTGIRDTSFQQQELPPPFPPNTHAFTLHEPEDLDHERVWAAELGYRGQMTDTLAFEIDGYYQRYEELIGAREVSQNPGQPPQEFVIENIDGADAWGAETRLVYEREALKLTGWYAYNAFEPDQRNQDVRASYPARHKVGAIGRASLPQDWSLHTHYTYRTTTTLDSLTPVRAGAFHQVDVNVAKAFNGGQGELRLGVKDVFDGAGGEVAPLGQMEGHETPGRTIFGALRVHF